MATIYQNFDVNLLLNGNSIFCSDLALNQSVNLSPVYNINSPVTQNTISNGPAQNSLNISYFFTGKDPLRDYIYTNSDYPLSGYLAGLRFNQGYLESYTLNAAPQSLININAVIRICDELSGNLIEIVHKGQPTGVIQCTSNNIKFNLNNNFSAFEIENIKNYNWSYQADIEPIYFQRETGQNHLNPDRVIVSNKEISCNVITNSNNNNLLLPYSGDNYSIEMLVKHPNNTGIFETYGISGKINKKDFSISQGSVGESSYTITQWHINEEPKIATIDNSNVGYILINSPNFTNGYFSNNKNLPLVEKVLLEGEQLKFNTNRGTTTDTITGFLTNNSINGALEIQTSKGTINYPSDLTFNFSGIGVSGFKPETGNYQDTILISGTNFFRISQVLFNGTPANFQIKQSSGISGFHEIIASVPNGASVGKITVLSTLKNRSGISTGNFYPIPIVTGLTPTGMFSGTCIIEGFNFSGISNVYFNNVRSPSFIVNNNSKITATIPGTGAGYTKGYIKISGFQGMSALSNVIYQPIIPIYGLSTISGTIAEDMIINTIVDTGFFCPVDGGFKISFGKVTGVFVPSGTGFLTGLIPNGYFDNNFVSIYEPDGVGKYPPFTGRFTQVGPAPEINLMYPNNLNQYSFNALNLEGNYFKDFFGLNNYAMISGFRTDPPSFDTYNFPLNTIFNNNLQTKVTITGVRITGATGYYTVYLNNYVGTGSITGLKISSGIDWAQTNGAATIYPPATSTKLGIKAIDGGGYNSTTITESDIFGLDEWPSGYLTITFNNLVNINLINLYQNNTRQSIAVGSNLSALRTSGTLQLFDGGFNIIYSSGIFWNDKTFKFLINPFTGIKALKLNSYAESDRKRHLSWNTIQVY